MSFHGKFRCKCGIYDFNCRWRTRSEDIVKWMETAVMPGISNVHRNLRNGCQATHADIMLPIDEAADGIGLQVVQ